LPITAVCNTVEWSFCKLQLIKRFTDQLLTDEGLTNLAMTSIESETAKTLGMTELIKNICIFESL